MALLAGWSTTAPTWSRSCSTRTRSRSCSAAAPPVTSAWSTATSRTAACIERAIVGTTSTPSSTSEHRPSSAPPDGPRPRPSRPTCAAPGTCSRPAGCTPDLVRAHRGRVERQGLRHEPRPALPRGHAARRRRHPYEVSKSCADLVSPAYALTYDAAHRHRPVRQHLRRRRPQLEPHRARARSARSSAGNSRSCAATGPSCATTSTSTTSCDAYLTLAEARRPTRPCTAQAFNFSDETPLSVTRDLRGHRAAAFGASVEPDVRGEAVGEIHDQYLDATKARDVLGWTPAHRARRRPGPHDELVPGLLRDGHQLMARADDLRAQILELVRDYHAERSPRAAFVPGETPVPVSGKVFDAAEMVSLIDSSLDFWLTTGRFAAAFEERFADWLGVRHAMLCNSGSSREPPGSDRAHLARRWASGGSRPGDEVAHRRRRLPDHGQPDPAERARPGLRRRRPRHLRRRRRAPREAVGPRTRADHDRAHPRQPVRPRRGHGAGRRSTTCGSIEDSCDALGARYDGAPHRHVRRPRHGQLLPRAPHHDGRGRLRAHRPRPQLQEASSSRSATGAATAGASRARTTPAGERFDWQLGELPHGYDHKYMYSHIGYNLKLTDMQAAVGLSQLDKLDGFVEARAPELALTCVTGLADLEELLVLPEATPNCEPELVRLRPDRPAGGARRAHPDARPTSRPPASAPACCSAATCCASRPTPTSPTGSSAPSTPPTRSANAASGWASGPV